MSRRRQFEQEPPVIHGYWPHSDPDQPERPTDRHADTPCPGSCNREFRKAEETNPRHDVVMHPGRPVWCRSCADRITGDLAAIRDLAANLAPGALNTPRDIRADDRGMGSSSGMVHPPTNSPAWDEADELIRWALTLEDELRGRLGQPRADERLVLHAKVRVWRPPLLHPVWEGRTVPVTSAPPQRTLAAAIRYLTAYATALLSGDDAETIGRQVMRRKRQLEEGTGADRLVHRLPGLCMVCDRKGLQRQDGGELVKCRHCGATWAWEHYERLSKAYADDVRRRGA